ncbi:MAG: hypothetical protein ACE14V_01790 [bacterium]
MRRIIVQLSIVFLFIFAGNGQADQPIYIAFLWHMHQPIYWPGETVTQTESAGHYSFSVVDIFRQRIGPYTTYPIDAIESGKNAGLAHLGASVSFSGSLMENLDNLKGTVSEFASWESRWVTGRTWSTSLGNPRLDIIGFGYYHPLNGLIEYDDIRRQIQLHKLAVSANFGSSISYSKGYFPAETAFSPRMILALVDEGIQWVIVDNIHFDRACLGYPWNSGGNIYEPNPADQQNPNPNDWISLTGLWAPTPVSAKWGHQPHYVSYIDPATGTTKKIIAVPADRYMGNEDGRGGFGALSYDAVMSQLESYNTDTAHPLLIVLHHDGDNYGGGTDSYYHSNFDSFITWLQANPTRFVCTTIQDYLDMFPPDTTDIIHIEDGSWAGADNGDPEFKKWNGDADSSGYSADRNSWGVIVAGKNRVNTARQINPSSSIASTAYTNFLLGEASDYWYWEPNSDTWDGHPTRASNIATLSANSIIGSGTLDTTGPTIYLPQREPYNPGGNEWGIAQSTTFTVWSYIYDVSGLTSTYLKYRIDTNGIISAENETYSGGTGVGAWVSISLSSVYRTPQTSVTPYYKAWEYSAAIGGLNGKLYDFYIEATDKKGYIARSPIRHVKLGANSIDNPSTFWIPATPTTGQTVSIYYDPVRGSLPDSTSSVYIHLGYNHWATVLSPDGSMNFDSSTGYFRYDYSIPSVATTVDFCFNNGSGIWDNNSGQDWHITISGGTVAIEYVLDGSLDTTAQLIATSANSTIHLWAHWNGTKLYLATEKASGTGQDRFIILAKTVGNLTTMFWSKSGLVAKYDAFIGNEADNNWSGWFGFPGDTPSDWAYAQSYAGTGVYLEGTIQLQPLFYTIPDYVELAVAGYPTANGSTLTNQAPVGNGNQNIDSTEFIRFYLNSSPTLVKFWNRYRAE